ncbi:MAG TPA: peptidyl-prolyl cis-trans isomerase [Candidatus Methylomirabilis sp.]|nr:peptidyl-prolyl cis-trans isomerase [Candidatus Methylomirabilis sp.]
MTTRALLPWAILIVLVNCQPGAWSAEPEIVARVNGEPITRAELQRMLADPLTRARHQRELGINALDSQALDRWAMRELIHRRLILQEAGRRNVTVSEQDFDRALGDLRRRFKDLKSFGIWMKERGLDDKSLSEAIRTDLLMTRVKAALVEGVSLTKKDVQKYYDAHQDELRIAEAVRLRIIAVKDKAAGEQIMAALRIGADFGRVARERSLGLRAKQGGDTGWVSLQTLPPPLRQAVGTLKVGDTSGPVQRGAEFLVVRLEARRPARTRSLAEVQPEIEKRLLATKQRQVVQAWLSDQEKKARIAVLLQPGSIAEGAVNARSND